jgi:ubiquinone/menaquinone biosynthesis C-methylase UbiE
MALLRGLLMRAFGRPEGLLGRIGGVMMARGNRDCAAWVVDLLAIEPQHTVLEVGFGPGIGIALAAAAAPAGRVAGIDPSRDMLAQAKRRNDEAIRAGRVDLHLGTADTLPFADGGFDKAFAINSMKVWPDPLAGLRELRRVLRRGGRVALGFTPPSGQKKDRLVDALAAAGFAYPKLEETDTFFCALATRP